MNESSPFAEPPSRLERLLTVQQLSDYLGVPVKTLYERRTQNAGPRGQGGACAALSRESRDRVAQGFVPWANMFEFSLTSSAIVVGVFIVLQRWQNLKFLGVYVTGFALITLGVGTVNFYVPVKPLPPALDSYWLIIHVFVASLGTAFFAIGAGLSIVQLLQARREAGKKSLTLLKTLPDAVKLENLAYLVTVVGFVFWTFILIAGAIWAERAWGRY